MSIDIANADAAYRPFPPFSKWAEVDVDMERWRRCESTLEELRSADAGARARALEIVRRAAAVQTGAIEGLYPADRGFTFTVAAQSALMEGALERRTDKERALIQDQLAAYEHVLDFATRRVPVAEAWIRELHRELCKGQSTYRVHTPSGDQEHELPLGAYKSMPNHVLLRDGSIHSYSPVLETPREMERLVSELASAEFAAAHPIVQAAYAHHALVAIHPFADGNGRVARALGSVYTCRAYSLPLFIFEDARSRYFDALATADLGRPAPFVDFVLQCCVDAVNVTAESFRAASQRPSDEISEGWTALYKTQGGFEHRQVDQAAKNLSASFARAWAAQAASLGPEGTEIDIRPVDAQGGTVPEGTRLPIDPPAGQVIILARSAPPANAAMKVPYGFVVPVNCKPSGEVQILDQRGTAVFAARIDELLPAPGSAVELRLAIAVDGLHRSVLSELQRRAAESLRSKGY
jgi:fido (protein-threonine AMPylation protein)